MSRIALAAMGAALLVSGGLAVARSTADPAPYEATVDVRMNPVDRDIAISVLMQKYSDVTQRIDVEKEKKQPDKVLVEQLVVAAKAMETKILALQQGDAVDMTAAASSVASASKKTVVREPLTQPSEPPPHFESWDVFKNFSTEGSNP